MYASRSSHTAPSVEPDRVKPTVAAKSICGKTAKGTEKKRRLPHCVAQAALAVLRLPLELAGVEFIDEIGRGAGVQM